MNSNKLILRVPVEEDTNFEPVVINTPATKRDVSVL